MIFVLLWARYAKSAIMIVLMDFFLVLEKFHFHITRVPSIVLQCGSHRSVAPIKAGFVARVGRRKAGT